MSDAHYRKACCQLRYTIPKERLIPHIRDKPPCAPGQDLYTRSTPAQTEIGHPGFGECSRTSLWTLANYSSDEWTTRRAGSADLSRGRARPAIRFSVTLVNGGPSACALEAVALACLLTLKQFPSVFYDSLPLPFPSYFLLLCSTRCWCMIASCIKTALFAIDNRPKTSYIGSAEYARHTPDVQQHIRPHNRPVSAGVVAVVAYTASRDVGGRGHLPAPPARFGLVHLARTPSLPHSTFPACKRLLARPQ